MHNIEPYYRWREEYAPEDDTRSPFYGRKYTEWKQIYNFVLHPMWDDFESETLYLKVLMADYEENYAIIITTNAGLWRYKIGDTISFTSLNPFRIKITGRTAHFINAFGEELIISNAEKALADACSITGAIIKEYTAAPIYFNEKSSGAHEGLIEFDRLGF